jgi:hypothetical protein
MTLIASLVAHRRDGHRAVFAQFAASLARAMRRTGVRARIRAVEG